MIITKLVPYVLTFNEEPNIRRCLEHLRWADRVVVVDSFSTDDTHAICNEFPNVEWFQRSFESHSVQHSFALDCVGDATWVLRMDADWTVPLAFVDWLRTVTPTDNISAFSVPFSFLIHGSLVSIAHYPHVPCLYKKSAVSYVQDGHTERLKIHQGEVANCPQSLIHDDRKNISRWIVNQSKYSLLEADQLASTASLNRYGRVRRLFGRFPIFGVISIVVFYLIFKIGAFRNLPSKHYVLQRIIAELCVILQQLDQRLQRSRSGSVR